MFHPHRDNDLFIFQGCLLSKAPQQKREQMMCHVTASRTVLLGAKPWGGEEGLEEGNSQQWQNWLHHLQGLLQNPKHGVTCLNIIKNFKAVTEGIKPNIGPFQVDPHWYFETYPQHIYK